MVPVMCILFVLTYPLALVLPLFVQSRIGNLDNNTKLGEGYYLPSWLSWFQTPDNSIDGDQGWREEHMQWRFKFPPIIATYLGRVGWLWRNPAYGYGIVELFGNPIIATYYGDIKVNDDPGHEGSCMIESHNIFQYVYVKKLWTNKSIYLVFGWNIKGLVNSEKTHHIATFAFSPRLSKFTEN